MERNLLAQLLAGDDEASTAALATLHGGASFTVWDGSSSAESLARIYARRLRHTRRTGTETLGLEGAVELLRQYERPVRLGNIKAADGRWVFMLFLSQDADAMVACTGVRQRTE